MEAVITILFLSAMICYFVWSEMDKATAARARLLAEARSAYQRALSKLKNSPTDAAFRQAALEAGRAYSNLTRESKGVTIFDEMALKNDLDAAAAGGPISAAPSSPSEPSVAVRLRMLGDLRAQNLISEEEFATRRMKILEEV